MELKNFNEGRNIIEEVKANSIAEELGVEAGDILLSINEQEVKDIIDYKYLITDDYVVVAIEKSDGEVWEMEIEKDHDEDIGIIFTNPLIDKAKSCRNKCVFCFIDQLPKGMRETLYFKDDDSRLSFLQGNFITLTNLSEDEISRIIKYRLSPINISVHTTDPELRIKILNNKNAGKINEILIRFKDAGIEMNCQIVLAPGINDGKHLEKTLKDLSNLFPSITSVAVVPVGMTKYREGLYNLESYDFSNANDVIDLIEGKQKEFIRGIDSRFVFAADEFYVLAKRALPDYADYEGFPQLENGVGLIRVFYTEVINALNQIKTVQELDKSYIIATGVLASEFMNQVAEAVMEKFQGLELKVVPIKNYFLGETITVSGLVTGKDLITQLSNYELKDGIIIPRSMLKSGEDIFLDNVTVKEIEEALATKIIISEVDGKNFINILKKA